jgi:hypothetical protein
MASHKQQPADVLQDQRDIIKKAVDMLTAELAGIDAVDSPTWATIATYAKSADIARNVLEW